MEDILTSEVFGLLRYIDPNDGLIPFISKAKSLDGTRPFGDLIERISIHDWSFWPTWHEHDCQACEPDVFIRFETQSGAQHAICIEAKYWSGKSNGDSASDSQMTDQLAKQWVNLERIASHFRATPALIYVTTHNSMPREEIAESIDDYRRNQRDDFIPPQILWLSWRELPTLFANDSAPVLRDIAEIANRLNLKRFSGFSAVRQCSSSTWRFDVGRNKLWHWIPHVNQNGCLWRFTP